MPEQQTRPRADRHELAETPDSHGEFPRLTDAQIADLNAGKWYFNIHTAANPGGEIRGQLKEVGR